MDKIEDKKEKFLQKNQGNNDKATVFLADEIVKKRLVVFVGAGCSVAMGLPSWGALISDIQAKFDIKTNEKDFLKVAAKIEKEIGTLLFREEIVERIKTYPRSLTTLHK